MDIETVIVSVLSSFGVSGIIGIYLQHLWSQKRETELRIQGENRGHYESNLVWMRIILKPEMVENFNVARLDPLLSKQRNPSEIKKLAENRLIEFYYSSVLFSPDYVLTAMKEFIKNPTEVNFMKSAIAMRKDLWNKKTKVSFEILSLEQKEG